MAGKYVEFRIVSEPTDVLSMTESPHTVYTRLSRLSREHPGLRRWVMLTVVGILLALSFSVWYLLDQQESRHLQRQSIQQAEKLAQRFEAALSERVLAVDRMAKRWEAAGGTPQRLWRLDAQAYLNDMPAGFLGLRWIDNDLVVRWAAPDRQNKQAVVGRDLQQEPFAARMLARAKDASRPIFSEQLELPKGERRMGLIRALTVEGAPDGYLVAAFNSRELFTALADEAAREEFGLRLGCKENIVYQHGQVTVMVEEFLHEIPFASGGCQWQLSLWPTPHLLAASRTVLPEVVLAAGLLFTLLLAGMHLLWRRGETQAAEAKAAQQRAEESQCMLQTILDTVPLRIFWKDRNLTYLGCNQPFATDAGKGSPAEVVGRSDFDMSWSSVAEQFRGDDSEVMTSGRARLHYEEERVDAAGRRFWLRTSKVPMRDPAGNVVGVLGIYEDVTYEKEAELQQRLAATVFEKSREGITITDAHGNIITVNRAFTEITGYRPEEVLGKNPRILSSGRQDRAYYRQMWETLRTEGHWRGDIWNRRKSGEVYPEILSITEVRDDAGRPLHYIAVFTDISDRKEMEESLQAAKEAAEAANQAKSEFLASMSHELRTPLNAILGFAQLFTIDEGLSAEGREHAQEIERAGRHLLGLINDLIDLARIEAGKLEFSLEPVTVAQVAGDALKLVEPLARERGIRLIAMEPERHSCVVRADHLRLRQVLVNLLTNAVKYNRPHGEARIFCERHDGMVHIQVQDTGPGIPERKRKRVFDSFDRLGAERGPVEGSGIGLVVCKHLVEAMGGTIDFNSEEGVGTTFRIAFPQTQAVDAPSQQETARPSERERAHDSTTARPVVLHIEDNPMNLRLMRQIFTARPEFELQEATSAEAALERIQQQRPDLILMDINLPGMDGYAALKVLRRDPATRHIPIIAISANAMKGDAERGLAAGFDAYLTKPIDIPAMLASVERHIAGVRRGNEADA